MAGLNLAAIGAGLGEFAKQYQAQRAQQERTQMLQMQIQQYQQQMREKQDQEQAASIRWGLEGGGEAKPVGPMGDLSQMGNLPGASAPTSGGPRMAGEGSGRGEWGPMAEPAIKALRDAGASDAFVQAAMAQGLAEGGFKTNWNAGDRGSSFGPWQYHQGGELNPYMTWAQGKGNPRDVATQAQYLAMRGKQLGILDTTDVNRAMDVLGTQFERYQGAGPGQRRGYLADAQRAMAGGALQPRAAIPDAPGQPGGLAAVPDFTGRMGGNEGASYAPPAMAPQAAADDDAGAGGGAPSDAGADQTVGAGGYRYDMGSDAAKQMTGQGPGGQQVAQAGPQTATDAPIPKDLRPQLNKIIPPEVNGRMSETALKAKIDQICPNCSARSKLDALDAEKKRLAPEERQRFEIKMKQWEHELAREDEAAKHARDRGEQVGDRELARKRHLEDRATEDRGVIEGPDKKQFVRHGDVVRPLAIEGTGEQLSKDGKPGKPTLLEYTTEDGKVERVEAQQMPGGQWVTADQLRAPIDVSKGKWSIVPASQAGAMGGTRDAAQRERQMISAREVVSDLQNVVELPITTTRGMFGGRTQGPGLMDALKENLAEKLTSEDAELANSALAGLARELSIIVSPVYGGKWAAESFAALNLKEGQTNNVKLYNLARMRQTADNALEAMTKSPRIGEAQKEYAVQMRDMLDKAVPWTPNDVISYRKRGDDRETFGQFVQKHGVGGAAKGGNIPPEAVEMLRHDKRPDARQQFDAIFGPGAADRVFEMPAGGSGRPPAATPGVL